MEPPYFPTPGFPARGRVRGRGRGGGPTANPAMPRPWGPSTGLCYLCSQPGHIKRNCPYLYPGSPWVEATTRPAPEGNPPYAAFPQHPPRHQGYINQQMVQPPPPGNWPPQSAQGPTVQPTTGSQPSAPYSAPLPVQPTPHSAQTLASEARRNPANPY